MSSNYWSSTTNANNTGNAWHVNFNNGNVNNNNKSNSYYVRAVRSGKCELLSFASVFKAYLDCRKRKRGTINALRFEYDLLENLARLAKSIQQGTYRPSPSVCFITTLPKLREIFAADFRDRIIHHLVVRELEKVWESRFIHDSYASRRKMGTHKAVKRLQRFMWKATCSMKRPAWYLQLDIRSFFMRIDIHILFTLLEKNIVLDKDKTRSYGLLYLLCQTIFHDCRANCRFRGAPSMYGKVPAHKSLFANAYGKGLPIGNLTSQFFSNVYLHELDWFVKHELKCQFYLRYVDDFVLVSENKKMLCEWRDKIENFLDVRLSLSLKNQGTLRRVSDGVDFLGYIVRPRYILVRRRVVNNLKVKLRLFHDAFVARGRAHGRSYIKFRMTPEDVEKLRQTLSSYLGHFKHANAYNLLQSVWRNHNWLSEYFILNDRVFIDRFAYRGRFRSLRAQLHFFRHRLGSNTVVLVRIGKFYEFFGEDALQLGPLLKLRVTRSRRGDAWSAGFPAWMQNLYMEKILKEISGLAVIEEKGPGKFIAERYVHTLFRFGGQYA